MKSSTTSNTLFDDLYPLGGSGSSNDINEIPSSSFSTTINGGDNNNTSSSRSRAPSFEFRPSSSSYDGDEMFLKSLWASESSTNNMISNTTTTSSMDHHTHPIIKQETHPLSDDDIVLLQQPQEPILLWDHQNEPHKVTMATSIGEKKRRQSTSTNETLNPPSWKKQKSIRSVKASEGYDAKLKELEEQLKNLDPTSKEAKKQRRLIRNRMSAQLHRERKKAYVDKLEEELQSRENELRRLEAEVVKLKDDNATLRHLNSSSSSHTDDGVVVVPDVLVEQSIFDDIIKTTRTSTSSLCCSNPSDDMITMTDQESEDFSDNGRSTSCGSSTASASRRSSIGSNTGVITSNVSMWMAVLFSIAFFNNGGQLLNELASSKNVLFSENLKYSDLMSFVKQRTSSTDKSLYSKVAVRVSRTMTRVKKEGKKSMSIYYGEGSGEQVKGSDNDASDFTLQSLLEDENNDDQQQQHVISLKEFQENVQELVEVRKEGKAAEFNSLIFMVSDENSNTVTEIVSYAANSFSNNSMGGNNDIIPL